MSVSRAEQQLAWREDHMKQEVADVQKVDLNSLSGWPSLDISVLIEASRS